MPALLSRFLSLMLSFSFLFTSPFPAFALRTEASGQGAGLEELKARLLTAVKPAGLEEWQSIPLKTLPADLWRDLGIYGLSLEKAEYFVMRPPDGGGSPLQPFAHEAAGEAISMSVNQAIGSALFKGMGKDYKVIADGNAIFMGYHSLVDYTLRHRSEAFLILGDEGKRDKSISLQVGTVFSDGKSFPFEGMDKLRSLLLDLLSRKVVIRGVISDGLENTNDFVEGKPNSWGVTAVVDLPQDSKAIEELALIPDEPFRRAGWVYHAPRPAEGLDPFDLPAVGFPKIARAHNIDPDAAPEAYAEWMAQRRQVTLHGNRSFLKPARDQGELFTRQFPGFGTFFPNDGDLFPDILAAMGLPVDGHILVGAAGRSGANEAMIVTVAANNVRDAHFVQTYVSAKGSEGAVSLTREVGHTFPANEQAEANGLGISTTVGNDRLRGTDTKENLQNTGIIAMSAATGASRELAGRFAKRLGPVEFRADSEGLGGQVIVRTFVLARGGSAYIVQTAFRTLDLPETREWIKLASRLPSPVPPPVNGPAPQIQRLEDLADVVDPANITAVQDEPSREVSRTFRYVSPDQLNEMVSKLEVGYHLTFLHPGQFGQGREAEYNRTRGHFHSSAVGELVEVYDGKGSVLLWEVQRGDPGIAEQAVLLSVKAGDKFFVPPGWAHLTINSDPARMLVFGTWLRNDVQLDYAPVIGYRGGPWYVGPRGDRTNPAYANVPPLGIRVPDTAYLTSLGIPPDRSLWTVALTDSDRFKGIMQHVQTERDPALSAERLFMPPSAGLEEGQVQESDPKLLLKASQKLLYVFSTTPSNVGKREYLRRAGEAVEAVNATPYAVALRTEIAAVTAQINAAAKQEISPSDMGRIRRTRRRGERAMNNLRYGIEARSLDPLRDSIRTLWTGWGKVIQPVATPAGLEEQGVLITAENVDDVLKVNGFLISQEYGTLYRIAAISGDKDWVTVYRIRNGNPDLKPLTMTKRELIDGGFRFASAQGQLKSSPTAGLEEGEVVNRATSFNVGDFLYSPKGEVFKIKRVLPQDLVLAYRLSGGDASGADERFSRSHLAEEGWRHQPPASGLEEKGVSTRTLALNKLNGLDRFFKLLKPELGTRARPILIDASEDLNVQRLALGLSIMMARDDRVPEMDFRLVIRKEDVRPLLEQLSKVNSIAAQNFLEPRIVSYADSSLVEEAKWEALGQLAARFGFNSGQELYSSKILRTINAWSPGLALELRTYFEAGGLNFVSNDAFNRLKALLDAA